MKTELQNQKLFGSEVKTEELIFCEERVGFVRRNGQIAKASLAKAYILLSNNWQVPICCGIGKS